MTSASPEFIGSLGFVHLHGIWCSTRTYAVECQIVQRITTHELTKIARREIFP